jgi:hypothetical protein
MVNNLKMLKNSKILRKWFSIRKKIENEMSSSSNITHKILELVDRRIDKIPAHPVNTLKMRIQEYFIDETKFKSSIQEEMGNVQYKFLENENPIGNF